MQKDQPLFTQIGKTSFISGCLAGVLGIVLLLASRPDIHSHFWEWGIEKIIVGIGLIVMGVRWILKGLQDEKGFSLKDVFDPLHNRSVAMLLAQRQNPGMELLRMFRSKSFNLDGPEKARTNKWQLFFYNKISKKGLDRLFDYTPYPVGNFIARQSRPVVLFGGIFVLFCCLCFLHYLEILPFDMGITELNVFLLLGLVVFWRPADIRDVLLRQSDRELRSKVVPLMVVLLIVFLLYRRFAMEINLGVLLTLLLVAASMIAISIMAIRLIELEYGDMENIQVSVSEGAPQMEKIDKQPDVLFMQFANVLAKSVGWSYQFPLEHSNPFDKNVRGPGVGGTFSMNYIYETHPRLVEGSLKEDTSGRLKIAWQAGSLLIYAGLVFFFIGFLITANPLSSIYFILTGTAFFFLGNKLVYEIYLFFHTELTFESHLVFFDATGSFGEYEQINAGTITKRKDTFSDYTAEIKVCRVLSRVYIHPYLGKDDLKKLPRFIVHIERDDAFYKRLVRDYNTHLEPYRLELPPI